MKRKIITITEFLIILVIVIIAVKIWGYKKASLDSSEPYIFITKWGHRGSGNGQFYNPKAIVLDSKEYIYLADSGNYRIQKFNSNGKFIAAWGSFGEWNYNKEIFLPGQFRRIEGIYIDSDDHIYVADVDNYGLQEFDTNGNFLNMWGKNYSELLAPEGMVKNLEGNIYINNNDGILKFDSDWNFQGKWDEILCKGTLNGRDIVVSGAPYYYSDIQIDSSGYIYVVYFTVTDLNPSHGDTIDELKERKSIIFKLNSSGKIIGQWDDIFSDKSGLFSYIYGITIDSKDRIFVADTGNNRILILDTDGNVITQFGSKGSGNGQFRGPVDVAVDLEGNVYVLDYENCRIQKFKPNPDFKLNVNRKENK